MTKLTVTLNERDDGTATLTFHTRDGECVKVYELDGESAKEARRNMDILEGLAHPPGCAPDPGDGDVVVERSGER